MSSQSSSFDAAIVIGRFQPLHNGHLALLQRALSLAPRVLVVIGSALGARTVRNPWTHEERAAMIREALPSEQQSRVTCIPLRDYYDEPRWRAALVHKVHTQLAHPNARIVVVGHFKDATSDYLRGFAGWHLDSLPLQGEIHATALRERYLLASATERSAVLDVLALDIPASTVKWLAAFHATHTYAALTHELVYLNAYKRSWQNAPFPPVFVTTDALVTCQGHTLLIQRGSAPGSDLWALPGGFVELSETTLQSSLRELREETGLQLTGRAAEPVANAVFDHPQRSLRGRTISHVFHFGLNDDTLPHVAAADDARNCRWVLTSELLAMESRLFEDHLLIIDRFLQLLPHH